MSVSNQTDKIYGSGNGVTVTFSYPFKIFDPTQLLVYLINVSTGVVTGPMILNTDYTVVISAVTEGGSVTFTVAPPTGYNWFIKRSVPYTQAAVIPSEGVFPGKQFENQLDLMTMMVIQDQESVSRSFQLAPTSMFTGPVYMADPVDGTIQQYNATLNAYVNVVVAGGGLLPSPTSGVLTATNAGYGVQNPVASPGFISGASLINLPATPSGAGKLPTANLNTGNTAGLIPVLNSNNAPPTFYPYVKVSEQQMQNTAGGASTSGSWLVRVLNHLDSDTAGITSPPSSNQITLPAGTYLCKISSPFHEAMSAQIQLYDVTGSVVLLIGQSVGESSSTTTAIATVVGVFTLAASHALEVQYQVANSHTTDGLGIACNFTTEVYTVAEFLKIA